MFVRVSANAESEWKFIEFLKFIDGSDINGQWPIIGFCWEHVIKASLKWASA